MLLSIPLNTQQITLTAILSKLAYQPLITIQNQWKKFRDVQPTIPTDEDTILHDFMYHVHESPILLESNVPSEDTQVYIFKQKQAIYISFRGTSSLLDFTANVDIQRYCLYHHCSVPVPKHVTIHKGFYEQYRAIEDHLFSIIDETSQQQDTHPLQIVFCGHSLGGALAQIAAAHVASHPSFKNIANISCITFGGPRVGNKAFASWFSTMVPHHYRIVHKHDPIPNVPVLPFWQHTKGVCLYFTNRQNISIRTRDTIWYKRIFSFIKYTFHWSLENHAIDVYVQLCIIMFDPYCKFADFV
jgi:predicted lipase